jgi:hypothetical protein
MTNDALTAVREHLQSRVSHVGVGTDDSELAATNTGLGGFVTSEPTTEENDTALGTAEFRTTLPSASEANGADLTEVGLFDGDPDPDAGVEETMFTRITHSQLPKSSEFEVEYRVKVTVQND